MLEVIAIVIILAMLIEEEYRARKRTYAGTAEETYSARSKENEER